MSVLRIEIGEEVCAASFDDAATQIPVGPALLRSRELISDPPEPEELTNAIGIVVDHIDDLLREWPEIGEADVVVVGPEMEAIAAVELGGPAVLPFLLDRAAAEDVFRTLATERATDRGRNPGLAPQLVDTVVAGCCVLVGIMRRLHLDAVEVR